MKLKKTTLDVIKNFGKINGGMVIHEGSRIRTQDNLNKVIAYADIEDSFPHTFGVYDVKEFLDSIAVFQEPDFDFKEKYVIISDDSGAELQYTYANIVFVTEAPEMMNFPTVDDDDSYEAERQEHEEKVAQYNTEFAAYEADKTKYVEAKLKYDTDYAAYQAEMTAYIKAKREQDASYDEHDAELDAFVADIEDTSLQKECSSLETPTAPTRPIEPKAPTEPVLRPRFTEEHFSRFSLDNEAIAQLIRVNKVLGLSIVRVYSEADSEDIIISLVETSGSSNHTFKLPIDRIDKDRVFEHHFDVKRLSVLAGGDYSVIVSVFGLAEFKNDTHTYYIATESI
ncbi:hypothetical protein HJ044_05045 [Vibrio parahaemolyticus]|nr:hypothetical protein [Vibrio parahaemolyticus]